MTGSVPANEGRDVGTVDDALPEEGGVARGAAPSAAISAPIDIVAGFALLPTAIIADAMDRLGAVASCIRPLWPGARVCGRAFTVWTRAGDNALVHQALGRAEVGDVLAINGEADESRALVGEIVAAIGRMHGIAGFVIDGAARDVEDLERMAMPTFARAVTPAGPYKHGPGAIGRPIALGGVAVSPGDIVIGDGDGVVIVPSSDAPDVLHRARGLLERERRWHEQIAAGVVPPV